MGICKPPSFESRQLYDAILRQDLYSFVQAIFPIVSPGELASGGDHLRVDEGHAGRDQSPTYNGAAADAKIYLRVGGIPGVCVRA
jgi:hypothetical protein